ncbi:helix-turn-helix domain-containing protein [Paenibacillus woosongensis]|uniref:Helix-turn-helix domain-containing protein n=1 Tax=Paenibacillus woosongensis TaxID=307580 RepID=A0ABQ4MXE9_9BACL|nr:helix-turn-helix domain-containing protein [Paenibacillus woosongensis]GIP60601.1 hypothetical protein J15TS10_44150 [Paenibacillus woosongensis]
METKQVPEQAMNNLYTLLMQVLPKYINHSNEVPEKRVRVLSDGEINSKAFILSRHDLPNNLTAKEIHLYTNIRLRTVYDLMNKSPEHGGIPSFRVGKSIFSNREEFLLWWDETIIKGKK